MADATESVAGHVLDHAQASPATTESERLPRLLSGLQGRDSMGLAEHIDTHGPVSDALGFPGGALIDWVERSGLRGRGGARFPTGRKMRTVAAGGRPLARPIVVVNGMEGEPAAQKDRLLLDRVPHLVLDGALLAAAAIGASEVIVCVPQEAQRTINTLARALEERRLAGLTAVKAQVVGMTGGYVASEETALVHQLNGGPAKPTFTPSRPFERGVKKRPTLIDNVETLAHVGLIARHGPDWFRGLGTADEPGSLLVTLSGAVARPGVYEIEAGTRLADLFGAAGGLSGSIRALLIGGYFGSWVDGGLAQTLVLAEDALRTHGAALGAGVIVALPSSACGAAESARVGDYLARQSAGQCGPCVHGLAAIAEALEQLVDGTAGHDAWSHLQRWIADVPGRGACKLPDGATRFMSSALKVFGREFEEHARNGPCHACHGPAILPRPHSHELAAAA